MSTDTTAPSAAATDIPALIKRLHARSDNPPDAAVDIEELERMLATNDGKDAVYRMMQAEYRDRQDAALALSAQAADILSLKAHVTTLTEAAEDDAEFVSAIVKAICDHVGLDPDPEGYTTADLESLLEEHNDEIDRVYAESKASKTLATDLASEMVRVHRHMGDLLAATDPGADAFASHHCVGLLLARARSAGLLPASMDRPPLPEPLTFTYANWRGETAVRRARPVRVYYGPTEWHSEPQWLMEAYDADKGLLRTFAMRDMSASAVTPVAEISPSMCVAASDAAASIGVNLPASQASVVICAALNAGSASDASVEGNTHA